jgi:hypothetical protein
MRKASSREQRDLYRYAFDPSINKRTASSREQRDLCSASAFENFVDVSCVCVRVCVLSQTGRPSREYDGMAAAVPS